jgi:hypothetical protein
MFLLLYFLSITVPSLLYIHPSLPPEVSNCPSKQQSINPRFEISVSRLIEHFTVHTVMKVLMYRFI